MVDEDIEEDWVWGSLLGWITGHYPPVRLGAMITTLWAGSFNFQFASLSGHPTLTSTASL